MNEIEVALTEGARVRVKDPFPPEGVVESVTRIDDEIFIMVKQTSPGGATLRGEYTPDELEVLE